MRIFKPKPETVEFYILSKGQPIYSVYPFDEATLVYEVATQYIPRVGEMVHLKTPIKDRVDFRVAHVSYRLSKNKMVPCILLDK